MTPITINYKHIEKFRENFLPMYLVNNMEAISDLNLIESKIYNKFVNDAWNLFCEGELIEDSYKFTSFVHSMRMAMKHETRSKYALVLIKVPYEVDFKGEASTSIILAQDIERKNVRYFHLEELSDKAVPEALININQRYLLKEYNYRKFKSMSWGQLINPRDLSSLHDGILKLLI